MNWNPFRLDPPFNPKHGFIFTAFRHWLRFFGWPMYTIHELPKRGVNWVVEVLGGCQQTSLNWQGYFIEFWVVLCAYLNICVVLPYVSNVNWTFLSLPFIFLMLRAADFLERFAFFYFYLSQEPQRSVARSYTILIVNFLEAAAMFASLHFIIYGQFWTDSHTSQWQNLYYYCLMNMLTIGDASTKPIISGVSLSWFYILKVIQPMFGALFFAFAISRIIDWKSGSSKSDG